MKKNIYEIPKLQILMFEEEDVITGSTDWQGQYDDKGTWNPNWFTGNE
jgi:hypothetical protein